ncbi:CoA ester lyase [Gordonia terrae]|uniref:HpcH/HpaI aldolase/citrate lyase family protein n=1 Tax=Gordonia hongkongensis TaxID=1701090 RepID=UPI0022B45C54|nr:CoA ester lyase [Gordonia terrae]
MPDHSPYRRRAALVAPGSDERKALKALHSGADEVVLDLEDAVTSANKDLARDLVCRLVRENPREGAVSIRVNGLGTAWFRDDIAACARLTGLTSVVLPKTETVQDLLTVADALGGTDIGVQALVETPPGIRNVEDIAGATDRLVSLIIGYADLGAALGRGRSTTPQQWLAVQDRVLVAARSAGIAAIDGPFLGIADDEPFRLSCTWTADLGFDGKWVIHPAQTDTATASFTPSNDAVDHARWVLDALREAEERGAGAAQLDGHMLDEAVAVAARRTLTRVGEL